MTSTMDISKPNDYGALNGGILRIVARHGARSYAGVKIAFCEDGFFRFSIELQYSYGGFGGPVFDTSDGYTTEAAAETAGTENLLRKWPKAFGSEPASVHEELLAMRRQIEAQLLQPSLF